VCIFIPVYLTGGHIRSKCAFLLLYLTRVTSITWFFSINEHEELLNRIPEKDHDKISGTIFN